MSALEKTSTRIARRTRQGMALGLIMGATIAMGATNAVPPTSAHLLRNTQAALADELFALAQTNAQKYLDLPGLTPDDQLAGVILLARAKHGQKDYPAMRELLAPWPDRAPGSPHADALTFWLATAEFEMGNWQGSLDLTRDFARRHPKSNYLPSVIRLRAWSHLKLGQRHSAIAAFAEFTQLYSALPEDAANRLDWGRALMDAGESAKAREVLTELVTAYPNAQAGQEGRVLLAQLLLENNQPAAAQKIIQPLVQSRNVPDEIRGMGLLAMAAVAEQQTNHVEALALIDQCLTRIANARITAEANLRKGFLLLRMGKTEEGTALVRGFVATAPSNTAGAVQLELGRTLQQMGLHEKALTEFQNYTETFTDPAGAMAAWRARGEILTQLNRHIEAAAAFEKAAESATAAPTRAALLRQAGDRLYTGAQFRQAAQIYTHVMEIAPRTDMADQALFQIALCRQNQDQPTEALDALWEVIDAGAEPELAAQAFLQMAEILQRQGLLAAARDILRLVSRQYPPPARARAFHQLGLMDYRLGRFDTALEYFERVNRDFPGTQPAQLATYMRGWCFYMLDQDQPAVASFEQFIANHPSSPRAPDAMFWLAEYHFNHGAYYLAETGFLRLAAAYPAAPLADDALFWAGRAALMQKEFRRANEHFTLLIRGYPDTAKQGEARFYQGEALCELGEFADAILIFDEIIRQAPDGYLAEQAWFRKGDSQFTLGAQDPRRYEEAIASYQMILNRAEVTPTARLHAEYKIGRCQEKLGRLNEAFERYMTVVYDYFNHPASRARNTVWFTRAAFNAAALKEAEQSWRKAVAVYQRVVDANVAASRDAAERIRKIRLDQWMFFY